MNYREAKLLDLICKKAENCFLKKLDSRTALLDIFSKLKNVREEEIKKALLFLEKNEILKIVTEEQKNGKIKFFIDCKSFNTTKWYKGKFNFEYKKSIKERITFSIMVITFFISSIISIISVLIEKNEKKDNYKLNAISNKPILIIDSANIYPYLTYKVDTIKLKQTFNLDSARYYYKIKNIGNTKANIIAIITTDYNNGEDLLRDHILDIEKMKFYQSNPFYSNIEILPDYEFHGELILKFSQNFSNMTTTLHFLFIYENDMGQIFDTYFWDRIKFDIEQNNYQISIKPNEIDHNYSFKVYNKNEIDKLLLLVKEKRKQLLK